MAGLYPDDEVINVFGTDVVFPGLDPATGKFTNGDFSNPLVKPSFIPAGTINLVVDNLQTLISGLGLTPNNTGTDQLLKAIQNKYSTTEWFNEFLFPVGCRYKQGINDPTPVERGFPGSWEIWSGRAESYGLFSGSLPSYAPYTPGANFALGAHALHHLPGDDWRIFRAREAINNAPADIEPVRWEPLQAGIIVPRRHLQEWDVEDFTVGTVLDSDLYAGWTVSEIIVAGGKFESVEGGNRPTFVSGGVTGEDRHTLTTAEMPNHTHGATMTNRSSDGGGNAFSRANTPTATMHTHATGGGQSHNNIPPTLSVRYWRRVA